MRVYKKDKTFIYVFNYKDVARILSGVFPVMHEYNHFISHLTKNEYWDDYYQDRYRSYNEVEENFVNMIFYKYIDFEEDQLLLATIDSKGFIFETTISHPGTGLEEVKFSQDGL